ncbi:surface antigen [Nocardioides sp. J9]|uniref:CHAP domain-containing protein n=1 Tax=unclassified Nocardioides TaxID=2615069 RepID=UPI0009FCABA0|nr:MULTISPECIES: CHAP domain-containing protein [unclassified Nocardioides]TWG95151.1 surface antigen [Nocardioides sp. J9]
MRSRGMVMRWGISVAASALFATLVVVDALPRAVVPLQQSAATTYLCSGYAACKSAGYSDAGYGAVSGKMYWRMYSGHNCTNYAAYRVIKNGGPATRPWTGGGNASEWGLQMKSITDQVPNVGAIAWWGRYQNGSGSAGHVAYVEKVVSSTEIIISEDSWGGTFHWRRITKSSGRWPSGFIHFTDKSLKGKKAPVVSGTAAVGSKLTATNGNWTTPPGSYSREWFVGGEATGVTTKTYVPKPADRGKKIVFRVEAHKSGYTSAVQESAPTAAVVPGTINLVETPTVEGTPFVDEVLQANPGTWSPAPKNMAWRWFADGKRLPDAAEQALPLTRDLLGKEISVVAVARLGGYTAASAPQVVAGKVVIGAIELTRPFAVLGKRKVGETLTVRPGTFEPADAVPTYQWLRDGIPIKGAVGETYRLVGKDAGKSVSVQVNIGRKNYAARSEVSTTPGIVKSPPTLRVTTASRKGKAIVRARVVATGVTPVTGRVQIRIGQWSRNITLVDGEAVVQVKRPLGVRPVTVRYLGSTVVPATYAKTTVKVVR